MTEVVIVIGRAQVRVIEVQTPRLRVVIGRFMQVGRAGHEAEHEIEGTTAQREDSAHPPKSNRIHRVNAMASLACYSLPPSCGT